MFLSIIGEGNIDDFNKCPPLNWNVQERMQSHLELHRFFFANSDSRSDNVPLLFSTVNGEDGQAAEESARRHNEWNARKCS